MTDVGSTLHTLLGALSEAPPSERIDLREPILAHGEPAIAALETLVGDRPELAVSVIAWFEVFAKRDEHLRPKAIAALRRLGSVCLPGDAAYAVHALERLGASPPTTSARRQTSSIPIAAGTEWPGFQAHEFGRNEGTRWRSADGRTSLAPILVRVLREFDPDFMSFGVERSPEIHFAVARRYRESETSGITASKLVVYAHGPNGEFPDMPAQVTAGWYIERGDGIAPYGSPDNPTDWDWPYLRSALSEPAFQSALQELMVRHSLALGDYTWGRYTRTLGWVARIEDGTAIARSDSGGVLASGWPAIIEAIAAVPREAWIDLHIARTWPAGSAIEAGQPFALRELAPLLTDLARVYLRTIGPGWRA